MSEPEAEGGVMLKHEVVCHKGQPLVVIEMDRLVPSNYLRRWYAEKYAFDVANISLWPVEIIPYREMKQEPAA